MPSFSGATDAPKKFWDSIPHTELAKGDGDSPVSPEKPKEDEELDESMMAMAQTELMARYTNNGKLSTCCF